MTDAKEVGWGTLGETFRHRAYPLLGEKIDKSKVFLRRFFPAMNRVLVAHNRRVHSPVEQPVAKLQGQPSPPKAVLLGWMFAGLMVGNIPPAAQSAARIPTPAKSKVFNIKDYGATGQKADDAQPSIQKAIHSCAAAGGGVVLVPPGQYTSGTL